MEKLADEKIVELCVAESHASAREPFFSELFRRHRERVASWCWRITGDVESASDLAQEIFLKAFQRLTDFRGQSKFTTWLYTIARNQCLDELRAKAIRPKESSDEVLEEMVDTALPRISETLERREAEELVRRLIRESLDEAETRVMTLHYFDDLSLDAINRILRLENASGAKAYIVSARRKLKKAFERHKAKLETHRGGRRAE